MLRKRGPVGAPQEGPDYILDACAALLAKGHDAAQDIGDLVSHFLDKGEPRLPNELMARRPPEAGDNAVVAVVADAMQRAFAAKDQTAAMDAALLGVSIALRWHGYRDVVAGMTPVEPDR